ncbi:MAG: DUF2180 family protein [Chloroflexi bacterium]|nr:DUF2180 family protein [Chloroflexota bacterium]
MDCYSCNLESRQRSAVAICRHCGAALCVDHKSEADSYRVGGMRYGCAHQEYRWERY